MTEKARDFDSEFWEMVTNMASRDHVLGRWVTLFAQTSEDFGFVDLPDQAKAYVYENYGLNMEQAETAFVLAQAVEAERARSSRLRMFKKRG